jgi:hypothetical protein
MESEEGVDPRRAASQERSLGTSAAVTSPALGGKPPALGIRAAQPGEKLTDSSIEPEVVAAEAVTAAMPARR